MRKDEWEDEIDFEMVRDIGLWMLASVLIGATIGAVITATIAALWLW